MANNRASAVHLRSTFSEGGLGELAAKLTRAERADMQRGLFFGDTFRAKVKHLGLAEISTRHGGITVALTPLGQDLRSYLKEQG